MHFYYIIQYHRQEENLAAYATEICEIVNKSIKTICKHSLKNKAVVVSLKQDYEHLVNNGKEGISVSLLPETGEWETNKNRKKIKNSHIPKLWECEIYSL